ncbi:UPF0488 protein C8orf33 homolog [Melanerpes formicivorus]|uniref:UPF0488 protein C8orf33 homolog n=1 Tax=Melanerpes formicivorus TaxID=211600 RepID=UPI003590207A
MVWCVPGHPEPPLGLATPLPPSPARAERPRRRGGPCRIPGPEARALLCCRRAERRCGARGAAGGAAAGAPRRGTPVGGARRRGLSRLPPPPPPHRASRVGPGRLPLPEGRWARAGEPSLLAEPRGSAARGPRARTGPASPHGAREPAGRAAQVPRSSRGGAGAAHMERAPQGTVQDELEWCISQLETNPCLSPTSKQAEDTQHSLEVLGPPEMPLGKKQQVVNHVLEDCHLREAEEQEGMGNAGVNPGDVEGQQSSGQASGGAGCGKQSEQSSEAKPDRFPSPDSGFQSDFAPSKTDPEATGTPLEAVPGVTGAEQVQNSSTEQENWNGALSSAAPGQEPTFASNSAVPAGDCPLVQSVAASQHTESAAGGEGLANSAQISALQKSEWTQSTGCTPRLDGNHVTLKIPQPQPAAGQPEMGTEKLTTDGAAQKKKKKKQKPSASKKEAEKAEANKKAKAEANRGQKDTSQQAEAPQQLEEQVWKEVDWCVEQLELGLKTQKSTPRQAAEAVQAIRTLRSDKAPLVKKRQLMRAMFGDYRKKMEEEWCRELKLMEAAVKSARVVAMQRDTCRKSCQFIRKHSGACRKSQASAGSPAESPRRLTTGLFKFLTPQEEFHFNFLEESHLD